MENFLGLLVRVRDLPQISEYLAGFDRMSKSLRHDKIDGYRNDVHYSNARIASGNISHFKSIIFPRDIKLHLKSRADAIRKNIAEFDQEASLAVANHRTLQALFSMFHLRPE